MCIRDSSSLLQRTTVLLAGGRLSTARSTVVRCRRDEKRVLGDALSDVEKRIREIR